jgi:hypothetical protein
MTEADYVSDHHIDVFLAIGIEQQLTTPSAQSWGAETWPV